MSEPIMPPARRRSDLGAALTGLVVGAVVLFALMFSIVKLTNAKYAGHATGPAEAGHSSPAVSPGAPAPSAAPATTPPAPAPAGIRAADTSHTGH